MSKEDFAGGYMETEKYEIVLLSEDSDSGKAEAYEKVCRYLLQRYCEGCGEYESFGLFESIDGGTG